MCEVYVLRLEGGKFYVGKTNNVSKRYREHLAGYKSSSWTRKYKPISIEEVYSDADSLDEDKITVKYMMAHGIENVRGGPYVSIKLPDETLRDIVQRIRMASNRCVRCGSDAHFVMDCGLVKETNNKIRCQNCSSEHHFTEDCAEARNSC
ncbi:unnamed protein product [Sphacelaria rigidula]